MRVIYRVLALAVAAVVAAVAVLVMVLPGGSGEVAARPVAAPSAVPSSPAPPAPTASPSVSPSMSPSVSPSATPSPGSTIAPGYTPMEALRADPRVPALPARIKAKALPGRVIKTRGSIRDARSGLRVPRLRAPWKVFGPAPFATRQVLPKVKSAGPRGMVVTCPVPIEAQRSPRDTAQLAARWTLNHHPKGSKIRWVSSKRIAKGWALVYRVTYGKRSSMAAVAVLQTRKTKPALVFVTVPDTQRKRWADIRRVVSDVRVLG
ncbi:hypothetical protein [Nonomuraea sp. NPDC046570]|uniref:hypothetical protein n=1 Tax=Nonomuraea sp. NPDC046570 TaxID=3155255 RepID=UPI00340E0FB6